MMNEVESEPIIFLTFMTFSAQIDTFAKTMFLKIVTITRIYCQKVPAAVMQKNSCNIGRRTSFLRIFQNDIGE